MPAPNHHARAILERLLGGSDAAALSARCRRRSPDEDPLPPRLPGGNDYSSTGVRKRRDVLRAQGHRIEQVSGEGAEIRSEDLEGSIEDLVGFARIPLGVAGPLRVNGTAAHGDFYVPLATTEGALVASLNRGAHVVSQSGGAVVACLTESVARAPCFVFEGLAQVAPFLGWVLPHFDELQGVVAGTSRYCKLHDLRTSIVGKEVYLIFEFTTGDAAGQNMVTIATEAICRHILEHAPAKPAHWYLDGNLSGDKKATMLAFTWARGKKVVAEAVIERRLVERVLHTDAESMVRYWQISVMGGIQSGSIGVHGHYANALAALFIACGQDVACVAEASVGLTRMDVAEGGALYVSISMPNLIVGTVGGGTKLPTAKECLALLGCAGDGHARKLAEICCATALAGEISIIASMTHGDFGKAHATYGRAGRRGGKGTPS